MRYAIYFAADAGDPLMRLGNAWLGRDPVTGADLPQPPVQGMTAARFEELTVSPRRYGFHGTLKAPFFLCEGQTEAGLLEACGVFAEEIAPFGTAGLAVNRLGRFLALTPNADDPDLRAFADLCVRRFGPFRAPLSEADLKRRRQSALTARQDAYLSEWGYPYVFDEFRFHMTLSEKLDDDAEAALMEAAAEDYFQDITKKPRTCSTFALYLEPERGAPFQVHTVFKLSGSKALKETA
ncbi:DUF1045 domain-containing protein [Roseibium aggregatum]|uniref:DUF1045 domain-containing protein n=1 Tax=Roseibium aggregatum TaxID=187304 RepID=A0A939EHM9_9HYPH|nr:DUF1045 domain-containing protein [Roseibium aggregatum]MBN9673367.1 DUF1045 domain-containing protein [Roseibium aggregatum]